MASFRGGQGRACSHVRRTAVSNEQVLQSMQSVCDEAAVPDSSIQAVAAAALHAPRPDPFYSAARACHQMLVRISMCFRECRVGCLCQQGVGDKLHLVYECAALQKLKVQMPIIFLGVTTIRGCMQQRDIDSVAISTAVQHVLDMA